LEIIDKCKLKNEELTIGSIRNTESFSMLILQFALNDYGEEGRILHEVHRSHP
jgi:hypothetical protein